MNKRTLSRLLISAGLLLFITCYSSCDDKNKSCFSPPPDFVFDVRDGNGRSILPQYSIEDISLYYLAENNRPVAVEFFLFGLIGSSELSFLSNEGTDTFYLEIDAIVDTLTVEVLKDQSLDDCTGYFFYYVGFNGERAELDETRDRGVYILTRE